MASPHLRWLDDDAIVISYPFLTQKRVNGEAITTRCCKTRIWELVAATSGNKLTFTGRETLNSA